MYRILSYRGVTNTHMQKMWKTKLPLNLKVFMWQMYHDRLQTGVVLKKFKWKGDRNCVICGAPETRDHICSLVCLPSFCGHLSKRH
jgi:hypothetical protein